MAISKKIIGYLDEKKYKYALVEHKTTYTSFDTARTAQKKDKKIKPEQIVKALVALADKTPILALLPANRQLEKKKLLKIFNSGRKKAKLLVAKTLNLAKEAWMKKNIPGRLGATAPFREIVKMDLFIDNLLAKQKDLYAGSGEYEFSIKIPAKLYLRNEAPVKGSFSVKIKK